MNHRSIFLAMALILTVLATLNASAPLVQAAFESQIEILDRGAIDKLADQDLLDSYINVLVELKAVEAFHRTSGFKPQEYENYKNLLRYKILLLEEIDERKLKAPRLDHDEMSLNIQKR